MLLFSSVTQNGLFLPCFEPSKYSRSSHSQQFSLPFSSSTVFSSQHSPTGEAAQHLPSTANNRPLLFSAFTPLETLFSSQHLPTGKAAQNLLSTAKTSDATQSDDREDREDPSYGYTCPQVFLSRNGKLKNFVEQLCEDLERANISCFFDKDPQSLPKGENFSFRISEAAKKCKVGVVLSEAFVTSEWPMQELCAFVKNKDSLKRFWQNPLKVQKRTIDLDEWVNALEALRPINGVDYVEQEGEVAYRAQIVWQIRRHLQPNLKYEESYVRGKERLCEEVAELFNNAPCCKNGLKIAGLYGVGGIEKTTLARIVCNFYSNNLTGEFSMFDGRVLHCKH